MAANDKPKQIPAAAAAAADAKAKAFKGYTLEDIHYQRALILLQRQFAKEKIVADVHKIRKRGPFGTGDKSSPLAKAGGIASKFITGFNYVDYVLLGFSAFSTVRKVFRFFHKKK